MARYVLVDASYKIVNVCEWDGVTPWEAPEGITAMLDSIGVDLTWTYDGKTFTPPIEPDPAPAGPQSLTADQLATILIAKAGTPLTAQDVAAAKASGSALAKADSEAIVNAAN